MKIDSQLTAKKLDGYLVAVSALKDDGTFFSFFYLGEMPAEKSLTALCISLKIPVDYLCFTSPPETSLSGVPILLKNWVLSRRHMFNSEDNREIDVRLFDGFMAELGDLLGRQNQWLQVGKLANTQPLMRMGAIWDLFILSVESGSYAIHCSWDS